jgi:two-component system cell cycle sensor histidine kinase/response regulator CckA
MPSTPTTLRPKLALTARRLDNGAIPPRLPYPAAVALLAVLYYGAAKVGLLAAVAHGVVSSAWPPAGVALAALLLWGVRFWPGVAIGAFLLNATSGVSPAGAAGIAVGNTLEAFVGAWLLTRVVRFRPSLDRLQDVLALVLLAAVLSPTISATIGVASLWLSGAIASTSMGPLWAVWWSGDAMGVVGVAPFILTWMVTPRVRLSPTQAVEVVALLLVLVAVTDALFKTPFSYVYAIFPVVSWAALRFGPRGAATATLLVSSLAIWYTLRGLGPFVGSTPTHNLALLQTFIGLLAMTALVLAALMTERKAAEAALSASEAHYRLLFERNPNPLYVYDKGTLKFLAVNDVMVRHYGYSREEFLGMTLEDIRPHEEVSRLRKELAQVEEGLFEAGEWRHRKKDGTIVDVEITRHTLTFAGRPAGLVMALDVTRRKSLENQLLQAQKMEAIGRLAGGVAHDFNNLLTIIFGSSDVLLEDLSRDYPHRAEVEEIMKAARRAASLTRQLLAFSRRQLLEPQVLDLNTLVTNLEGMLRRLIGEDVEFRTVLTPARGTVLADPGQLEQVIMNLAVNARDAMPQGGKLTIETAAADLDEAYAHAHVPVRAGSYMMLAVSDTGTGMDAEIKARLFEPFFTTKEMGKGTGLGLATVYGIVKQSGGYIWVYSELGRGTTFKIYLPRIEADPEPLAPKPAPVSLRGSETVLVVEDEEAVRSLIRTVLETRGYVVMAAEGGEEALRLANAHDGVIHLLVTDVVMPGMSGRDLAQHLAPLRREMKALYLSGYTDDAIVQHGVLEPGIAFLQKPFTPQGLARKVREVLDTG